MGQHFAVRQHPFDQHLDRAAARLAAEQARPDHARVVDDDEVAVAQQIGQLAEHAVDRCRPLASSSRDALRSAAGCCAISSGGSSKSKSLRVGGGLISAPCGLRAGPAERERAPWQRPGGALAAARRARRRGQNSRPWPPLRTRAPSRPRRHEAASAKPAASAPQKALEKLGLVRDIDLALHLPLRYEDETAIVPIRELRDGSTAQVEGVVTESRVQFRPRRQLVVKIQDGSDDLVLRFLHFYPSHQKALAAGTRVRVRGEARGGFFGLEMVHPAFKTVDAETPLASAMTPVYPTTAQLPQAYLRKAVASALARADLGEVLPAEAIPPGLPALRDALRLLHQPPPDAGAALLDDREHPAWQRLKFEELLAQQLSQLQAKRERERQRAPAFALRPSGLQEALLAALPFALTNAQRRVGAEIAADLGRAVPMHRLLQGDVGSGKTVVAALARRSRSMPAGSAR
jgi:ATP-dependent DNA helicase RecG